MEDNDHWIQSKDSHFKIDQFYKMNKDFRKLELNHMLISIASNGGPIALTSDKKQILALRSDDPSLENVCVFSNDGQLTQKIKIQNSFREIIVSFQFIQDQLLLVLFEKGIYWIVDPYKGTVRKFDIKSRLKENQQIIQGKVFQNGFAILTSLSRFLFIKNCLEPFCMEFRDCELKSPPTHWIVIPPKQIISQKVQIHMTHPTAGIIQLIQDEGLRVYYNKKNNQHLIQNQLPEIKYIRYISSLSANGRYVAYFSAQPIYKQVSLPKDQKKKKDQKVVIEDRIPDSWVYRIIFISNDFQASYYKPIELKKIDQKFLDEKKRPKSIVWCGDQGIVIQYQNNQLFMIFVDGGQVLRIDRERSKGDQFTYLKQEIDGVRLQTRQKNKILRKIPQAYVNIFEPLSQKAGSLLFSAYMAFQQKQPLQDDQIRNKKNQLANAVTDCIYAAKFQEKTQISIQLMKAASYGKSFLQPNQIPNNIIQEVCKNLRVLNQIRTIKQLKRVITYTQFESLNEQTLLKLLLRYQMHYLAFQIYNYLKKSQKFRVQLFTHWACCKVESSQNQDIICSDIRAKLSLQKGVSFTEIAHKAIQLAKTELALKLLQYEPSLAKKVPLLLWMGTQQSNGGLAFKFFSKALSDAQLSKDPNLLCLVIQKIRVSAKLTLQQIFNLFSQSSYARSALISYYRIFDPQVLSNYYNYAKDKQMSGVYALIQAYKTNKYQDQVTLMTASLQCFKQQGKQVNLWRSQSLSDYIKLYDMFVKNHPKIIYKTQRQLKPGVKQSNPKPGTINEMLEKFLSKGNADAVEDFKSQFKISDKRVILTRIKVLIDQGKWQDLQAFVQKHQKKYKIPAQMVADLLMKKRQETWAMRMIGKMLQKDKDQQYTLLQRIGKIRQAITLAADRKDVDTLEDIKRTLLDPDLLGYLNEKLISLSRK